MIYGTILDLLILGRRIDPRGVGRATPGGEQAAANSRPRVSRRLIASVTLRDREGGRERRHPNWAWQLVQIHERRPSLPELAQLLLLGGRSYQKLISFITLDLDLREEASAVDVLIAYLVSTQHEPKPLAAMAFCIVWRVDRGGIEEGLDLSR
ncbi:hypothetical protein CPLU01_09463 [Colletotrichum plurivorum]|uniref:Uncharacterized protein n=1 Tax=Colletotrichum plurivorum TaxID=2175906 RepID=A0A8H6K8Q0_9PEZI|nr:hypothetical protein CPLU01_09463 [Colletotrichum plurivorum]